MKEHVELAMAEQQLPIPPANPDPVVTLRNEKKGIQEQAFQATAGVAVP